MKAPEEVAALDPVAGLLQMEVSAKQEERGMGGQRGQHVWGVGGGEGEEVGAPEEVAALDPVAGLLQMEVRREEGERRDRMYVRACGEGQDDQGTKRSG